MFLMKRIVAVALVLTLASLPYRPLSAPAEDTPVLPLPVKGVSRIASESIHNFFRVTTNLYSGSSPEGEGGYAQLAKLGVRTIISVDGARPDLEAARRHGLRYVHLPHGYDGIQTNVQRQLIQAVRSLPGPVFVHCHHGKHRGPAAAAIICLGTESWPIARAELWLHAAGTATNYTGLFAAVNQFQMPAGDLARVNPARFPEVAPVPQLVDAMVEIDRHWTRLSRFRKNGFTIPPADPDLRPQAEARLLWERFRELQRQPESIARGTNFIDALRRAEALSRALEDVLQLPPGADPGKIPGRLESAFGQVARDCVTCHKAHRD